MQLKGATELETRCYNQCGYIETLPASPQQTALVTTMSDAGEELQRLRLRLAQQEEQIAGMLKARNSMLANPETPRPHDDTEQLRKEIAQDVLESDAEEAGLFVDDCVVIDLNKVVGVLYKPFQPETLDFKAQPSTYTVLTLGSSVQLSGVVGERFHDAFIRWQLRGWKISAGDVGSS